MLQHVYAEHRLYFPIEPLICVPEHILFCKLLSQNPKRFLKSPGWNSLQISDLERSAHIPGDRVSNERDHPNLPVRLIEP